MTPRDTADPALRIAEEVALLHALAAVLEDERRALVALDWRALDHLAAAKDSLDARLRDALAARPAGFENSLAGATEHRAAVTRVRDLAHENRARFEACHAGLRAVHSALTGNDHQTYRRRRGVAGAPTPVLASSVE
jgi:hypothetical protein